MSVFIVGATMAAAAMVARHLLIAALFPDWTIGFGCIFIGGLIARQSSMVIVRLTVLTTTAWLTWALLLSAIPLWKVLSLRAVVGDMSNTWAAITWGAGWVLLLAALGEVIRIGTARIAR